MQRYGLRDKKQHSYCYFSPQTQGQKWSITPKCFWAGMGKLFYSFFSLPITLSLALLYFCCHELPSEDIFPSRIYLQRAALIFSWEKDIAENQCSMVCCQQNYFCNHHRLVWYVKNYRDRCNRQPSGNMGIKSNMQILFHYWFSLFSLNYKHSNYLSYLFLRLSLVVKWTSNYGILNKPNYSRESNFL